MLLDKEDKEAPSQTLKVANMICLSHQSINQT